MNSISRRLGAAVLFTLLLPAATASANGIEKGPYLQNPTTSTMTVCWVSDEETTGAVTYSPVTGGGAPITARDRKRTRFHRVKISHLAAHTRYTYMVECDGATEEGEFITAATKDQPFKFIAYGDNRTQPDKHAAVLRAMMLFEPEFVIQTGDLVANGAIEEQWDVFWQTVAPLVSRTAYFTALGNHEGRGAPYFRYFDVPREYSFDYGNIHFVALNSNRPRIEYKKQEEWLRRDLAAHQDATWRVVFFHHTMYTCTNIPARRQEAARLRERLEPIFTAGRVQIVVNGHDHNYQRHVANGITYIVSGGGGAPLYDVKPDTPFLKVAKKVHHHCELTVNGDKITFRAVEPNGTVIDQFQLNASEAAAAASVPSRLSLRQRADNAPRNR